MQKHLGNAGAADHAAPLPKARKRLSWSMRDFWLWDLSSLAILILPCLTVLLLWAVAERMFGVPQRPDRFVCFSDASHVVVSADRAVIVEPVPATAVSKPLGECTKDLREKLAQGSAAEPRARAALGITYAIALAFGAVLAIYATVTIARFNSIAASVTAAILGVGLGLWSIWSRWLPHAATKDLLGLLDALPGSGSAAWHGMAVSRCGCALVVVLATLYTVSLYSIAHPLHRTRNDADQVDELSKRFERLTTLSYIGALAFALALMTLLILLQWPLSLGSFGPAVGNTATSIIMLFGAYLTAILTAAYLPAAIILETQAECLALQNTPDLAARRDWLQKRGLTVVSTARLGASFATLIPLLAGGISSSLSAVSPLVSVVKP